MNYTGQGLTIPSFSYGNMGNFDSLNSYSTTGATLTPNQQYGFGLGQGFGLKAPTMGSAPNGAQTLGAGVAGAGADQGILGGLGMNIPTMQLGLGGIMALGNLYGAFQANKLAKDNFNFTKDVTNTNLNNQIKSYNMTLEDRARSRAVQEGRDQASADAYIDKNRLTR